MKDFLKDRPLLVFFILTFSLSWLGWIPTALFGEEVLSSLWVVPFLLGGFGPSAAGVIQLYRTREPQDVKEFWARLLDFKRISPGWYLGIFISFPILLGTAVGFHVLLGGDLPPLEQIQAVGAQPLMLVGLVVGGLLTGPLSEELGWRGYALDELLKRRSALGASLITAPIWWAWHLPLFWIAGTSQSEFWMTGSLFWVFLIQTLPLSILLTWSAVGNNRSILAPVLFHFAFNTSLSLAHPLPERVIVIHAVLLSLAAAGLVLGSRQEPSPAGNLENPRGVDADV